MKMGIFKIKNGSVRLGRISVHSQSTLISGISPITYAQIHFEDRIRNFYMEQQ